MRQPAAGRGQSAGPSSLAAEGPCSTTPACSKVRRDAIWCHCSSSCCSRIASRSEASSSPSVSIRSGPSALAPKPPPPPGTGIGEFAVIASWSASCSSCCSRQARARLSASRLRGVAADDPVGAGVGATELSPPAVAVVPPVWSSSSVCISSSPPPLLRSAGVCLSGRSLALGPPGATSGRGDCTGTTRPAASLPAADSGGNSFPGDRDDGRDAARGAALR
mmetsp:Transcript_11622/g.36757  ORF Transcript_11622/g.36757 Transcript_11622/m.36757 type:complete len:221 (+) Transcript_11622:37-699(+)